MSLTMLLPGKRDGKKLLHYMYTMETNADCVGERLMCCRCACKVFATGEEKHSK